MKILPMQITPMAYPGRSASYARYRAAQSVLDCGGPLPLWEPDEPRTSKVLGGWFAAQLGTAHKAPEDWRSPRRSASSAGSRTAQSALDCGGRAQRRHRFGVSERNGIGKSFVPIPNSAGVVRVSGDSPACFCVFSPSAPIRSSAVYIPAVLCVLCVLCGQIRLCLFPFACSAWFAVHDFAVRLVFPKPPCLPPMVVIK